MEPHISRLAPTIPGLLLALTLPTAPAVATEVEDESIGQEIIVPAPGPSEDAGPKTGNVVDPEPTGPTESAEPVELAENPAPVEPLTLLDGEVPPGTLRRLSWYASETLLGLAEGTPVLVAHGTQPGPKLCVTAAVHGDELNGIEIVRELLYGIDPAGLNGTVIGVPIVNLHGFRRGSRYLPDRRDLNRFFPGDPDGSAAGRIAHSFFNSVVRHCEYLVDLHTGSFHRANLPQLRADLANEGVLHLTKGFGATVVLASKAAVGTLRRAATEAGIPAVTVEAGEPMRFQPEEVAHGVKALRSVLNHLGMVPRFSFWGEPQPTYYRSTWVRAEDGGILTSNVTLGARVQKGDLLGMITDPITNARGEIRSPHDGRILGMALNQTMMPGYAAYHIGIRKSETELEKDATAEKSQGDKTDDPGKAGDEPERESAE